MDDPQLPLPAPRSFPTIAGRMRLRQKFDAATGNLDAAFTTDERWLWHGYDYGWRAAVLGDTRLISPIDPLGKWYDADLAKEAEQFYRANNRSPASSLDVKSAGAHLARNAWAREHGCRDFEEAIARGLVAVAAGRSSPGRYESRPAPNQSSLATAARAALRIPEMQPPPDDPVLAQEARERVGL